MWDWKEKVEYSFASSPPSFSYQLKKVVVFLTGVLASQSKLFSQISSYLPTLDCWLLLLVLFQPPFEQQSRFRFLRTTTFKHNLQQFVAFPIQSFYIPSKVLLREIIPALSAQPTGPFSYSSIRTIPALYYSRLSDQVISDDSPLVISRLMQTPSFRLT